MKQQLNSKLKFPVLDTLLDDQLRSQLEPRLKNYMSGQLYADLYFIIHARYDDRIEHCLLEHNELL